MRWGTLIPIFLLTPILRPLPGAEPVLHNTAPGVAWIGSKACGGCHRQIYDSYLQTSMGRSMSAAAAEPMVQRTSVASPVPNRFIDVYSDRSGLYQSEYEKTAGGSDLFRVTRRMEFAIGSGMNGKTYITSRDEFLYEAPLSIYSRVKQWGLSPGYEKSDSGFRRPILAPCITCHSGRPRTTSAANGRFESPPFQELAIGCENCHGPGQLHAAERGKQAVGGGRRLKPRVEPSFQTSLETNIVNPARLPVRLAENICMRCHQGGDAAVLQPGKDYNDFRPGTWLAETLLVFQVPRRPQAGGAEVLDHFNAMNLSRCFRLSQGKLTCTTCHDPHAEPAPEQAAASYRAKCLTCHQVSDCTLPVAQRNATKSPDDCVACHMPSRGLRQFSHSALTDHRIPRVPSEPYTVDLPHPTASGFPPLTFVNPAATGGESLVPEAAWMLAYGQLAPQYPEYRGPYLALLERLSRVSSNDPGVLGALGRHELGASATANDERAAVYLRAALKSGGSDPEIYQALGDALGRLGRPSEAIEVLERAIGIAPWNEPPYKLLIQQLLRAQRIDEAVKAARACVERFPEDSFMRGMLAKLEAINQTPP